MIVRAMLRIMGSAIALVTLHYLLGLGRSSPGVAVTILIIGLVVFIGLVAFQVRSIIRSPFPGLRAIEALTVSVPLFLLLASSYVVMATMSASTFGGRLTHTEPPMITAVSHDHAAGTEYPGKGRLKAVQKISRCDARAEPPAGSHSPVSCGHCRGNYHED